MEPARSRIVVEEEATRRVSVLLLVGRHDVTSATQASRALTELLRLRSVVVDLRPADAIDEAIAAVLHRARVGAELAGRRVVLLVDDVPPTLAPTIDSFVVTHDREDAIRLAEAPRRSSRRS